MSWTTVLEQARWFADQFKSFGYLEAIVLSPDCLPRHKIGLMQGKAIGVRESHLTSDQLRELLPGFWTMEEYPLSEFGLRYRLKLFNTAGFVTDEPKTMKPEIA